MAAAEARAAWQRTANRCLVQEDAKRAPKLACCPSSSCMQQYDSSNGNTRQEYPAPSFMPLNWNPMNSNLPPDTKWWLQLEPSFGYQKDFICELLNALEDELEETKVEATKVEATISTFKQLEEPLLGDPMDIESKKSDRSFESPWMVSTAFMKPDLERRVEDMKTVHSNSQHTLKRKADMGGYFSGDEKLIDRKSVDGLFSQKTEKDCFDMESPWEGGNKCEPWWRICDKDELASLVALKSQEHIENCDLPRPTQISRDPFTCLESLDSNSIFSSSVGRKLHAGKCNPIDYAPWSTTSGSIDEKHWPSSEVGNSLCDTEKLYSHTYRTTAKDPSESRSTTESDPSRAQLLEALRHSQTRAREAELAAQQAYDEKEHIVKLLFRQASHLFAYKQWLQMLQLESLCLQLRIKDHQIPMLFPVRPWMPSRGKPSRKGKKPKKCNACKYAVAFAVGLGLAGAGLLLGWTLGWLLPRF